MYFYQNKGVLEKAIKRKMSMPKTMIDKPVKICRIMLSVKERSCIFVSNENTDILYNDTRFRIMNSDLKKNEE